METLCQSVPLFRLCGSFGFTHNHLSGYYPPIVPAHRVAFSPWPAGWGWVLASQLPEIFLCGAHSTLLNVFLRRAFICSTIPCGPYRSSSEGEESHFFTSFIWKFPVFKHHLLKNLKPELSFGRCLLSLLLLLFYGETGKGRWASKGPRSYWWVFV